MAPELSGESDTMCTYCKAKVVKPSLCPGCSAPYHPVCVQKTTLIPDVGLKKCCGAPSPSLSRSTSPEPPVQVSMDQLRAVVREESEKVQSSLLRVEKSIAELAGQLSKQNDRLLACESNITNIISQVDNMESKVENSENVSNIQALPAIFEEWENRCLRKNNIIIFGLRESISVDGVSVNSSDINAASDIFNIVSPGSLSPNCFKCSRVGFLSQVATKPRPLKLIFEEYHLPNKLRREFLKNRNLLPPALGTIVVAPDRTKAQQAVYQSVRKELAERLEAGEENLVIAYRHGTPIIVTSRPRVIVSQNN